MYGEPIYAHRIRALCQFQEAYRPTNTNFIANFLDDLRSYPPNIVSLAYGIDLQLLPGDEYVFNAGYDVKSKKVLFEISTKFLEIVKKETNTDFKNQLAAFAAALYVHEDTHAQQCSKYPLIYQNYIPLKNKDFLTKESALENAPYFCQNIEADAYGRQVATEIKLNYPHLNKDELFQLLKNNQLKIGAQFIIDIYRDPLISEKHRKKFFRALYDELGLWF